MIGIGVLASGGGSNFQALAEAARDGKIPGAEIRMLIVNKPVAGALARALIFGIDALIVDPRNFPSRAAYYDCLIDEFKQRNISLICLAGYLLKIEPNFLKAFPNRVLNIHPALLPKYGGAGMYGRHVHAAVVQAKETESGCTVHWVDEEFDHGPALMQARVPVLPDDTPEALAARVLKEEHKLYPEAVRRVVQDLLKKEPA